MSKEKVSLTPWTSDIWLHHSHPMSSNTGGGVSPPEDERGQVDKSVPTNKCPGPSVNPSSGDSVPSAEDDGGPVDKSAPTNEGPGSSDSRSNGGGVHLAEDDGGLVDKSVLTNFESHAVYAI
ncbi:hypothetical protein LguiB_022658 [Lonicera macranthoides]